MTTRFLRSVRGATLWVIAIGCYLQGLGIIAAKHSPHRWTVGPLFILCSSAAVSVLIQRHKSPTNKEKS